MRVFRHFWEQPFVVSTGLAAFVHSTWALGTLFAGRQPEAAANWQFIGWIVPAALIAFALDVGQIATAAEIRAGQRTKAKFATFIIFAVATYYLQWLYMAHHMPALQLSQGVQRWQGVPVFLRDAAIWIIPALLPLSTALYTLSTAATEESQSNQTAPLPAIFPVVTSELPQIAEPKPPLLSIFSASCEYCDWQGEYDSKVKAVNALNGHLRYCEKKNEFSVNGHK